MVEKEVKVKISTEVDKAAVEDLEDTLKEMQDNKVTVPVEVNSEELEELNGQIDDTKSQLDDLKAKVDVDKSEIDSLESELADLEATQLELTVDADLSSVDDVKSSVEDLETEIENVNNTPISPQSDTSGVDNASESVSGLNEALTAVGAGVSLAGMEQMVATAGNIQDSWNRLGLTFGEVTGQMKTDISEASEATGRSGSLVRGFFNDMGMAGIQNTELLQSSFEALSGRAYQTGASIESLEQRVKMMVMSGNAGARQLTQLGITTADLGRVMGVSADEASKMFKSLSQEERLRVLTQAMGDGKQANDMYKNSWQGLKEQIDKATGALMGAIGSAILPVLIPVMKAAADVITFLANAFNALPEPIRAVIGIVGALVMGFLAYQTVMAGMRALNIVSIFTDLIGALRGVTMAQLASNAAALMNPYVLIAMAVIALIAALWYLYNTNEAVKQAFDHVGQALGQLWDKLTTALKPAIDAIINAWNGLMEALGIGGGDIFNGIIFFIVAFAEGLVLIINGITEFIGWLQQLWVAADQLINGTDWLGWLQVLGLVLMGPIGWIVLLIQHWDQIGPAVSGALSYMYQVAVTWFEHTKEEVAKRMRAIVAAVQEIAWGIYHFFMDPIYRIADDVGKELAAIKAVVMSYIQPIIDAFNALGSAASWAFSVLGLRQKSPGDIYKAMKRELKWTTEFVKSDDAGLVDATGSLGSDVVRSFNPSLTYDIDVNRKDIAGTSNDSSLTRGTVINNEFNFVINGDIDNDERMRKFADYIIELMNFDNNTAGRTV